MDHTHTSQRTLDPMVASRGDLWTIQDAAKYLAVSARTVERARNRGDFPPAVRIGTAVRFDANAVVAWAFEGQETA